MNILQPGTDVSRSRALNILYTVTVSLTFVFLVVLLILSVLAVVGDNALFRRSIINVGLAYPVYPDWPPSTNGGVSVPVWSWWLGLPCKIWILLIGIYGVVTVAEWRAVGYMYHSPSRTLPLAFYLLFVASVACFIIWMFLFSWGYPGVALGLILVSSLTVILTQAISYYCLDDVITELRRMGKLSVVPLIRGLVHNGLALYDVVVATLATFTLGYLLTQNAVLSVQAAGSLVLVLLLVADVTWTVLDLVLLDVFVRYVVTRHVVWPYFFLVILIGSDDWDNRNVLLTIIFLVISLVLLGIKIAFLVYRHIRYPDPRLQ